MPAFDPRPLALTLATSAAAGFGLRRWGGRTARQYAVAVAGAVLIFGLDWAYELPLYAYLAGILLTPFVYHRSVRSRLAAACRRLEAVPLDEMGVTLRLQADPGAHVALWRAEPLEDSSRAPLSIGGRPAAVAEVHEGTGPEDLALALDFTGEMDDDYQVTLYGESARPPRGELLVCHREADPGWLAGADVNGISGVEPWMIVRARPAGFAFELLDSRALGILHELFKIQSEYSELHAIVEGRSIRIVSTRTFNRRQLPQLVAWGARWIQKVRETV